ncbi:hypothetical protein HK405_007218 [Cladochytrium tenue]|nr:hypothetical protein HK405_007218 [Cladochytrium tenue]
MMVAASLPAARTAGAAAAGPPAAALAAPATATATAATPIASTVASPSASSASKRRRPAGTPAAVAPPAPATELGEGLLPGFVVSDGTGIGPSTRAESNTGVVSVPDLTKFLEKVSQNVIGLMEKDPVQVIPAPSSSPSQKMKKPALLENSVDEIVPSDSQPVSSELGAEPNVALTTTPNRRSVPNPTKGSTVPDSAETAPPKQKSLRSTPRKVREVSKQQNSETPTEVVHVESLPTAASSSGEQLTTQEQKQQDKEPVTIEVHTNPVEEDLDDALDRPPPAPPAPKNASAFHGLTKSTENSETTPAVPILPGGRAVTNGAAALNALPGVTPAALTPNVPDGNPSTLSSQRDGGPLPVPKVQLPTNAAKRPAPSSSTGIAKEAKNSRRKTTSAGRVQQPMTPAAVKSMLTTKKNSKSLRYRIGDLVWVEAMIEATALTTNPAFPPDVTAALENVCDSIVWWPGIVLDVVAEANREVPFSVSVTPVIVGTSPSSRSHVKLETSLIQVKPPYKCAYYKVQLIQHPIASAVVLCDVNIQPVSSVRPPPALVRIPKPAFDKLMNDEALDFALKTYLGAMRLYADDCTQLRIRTAYLPQGGQGGLDSAANAELPAVRLGGEEIGVGDIVVCGSGAASGSQAAAASAPHSQQTLVLVAKVVVPKALPESGFVLGMRVLLMPAAATARAEAAFSVDDASVRVPVRVPFGQIWGRFHPAYPLSTGRSFLALS